MNDESKSSVNEETTASEAPDAAPESPVEENQAEQAPAAEEIKLSASEASKQWLNEVARPLLQSEAETVGDEREVVDLDPESCGTDLENGVGCKLEVKQEGSVPTEIAVIISWRDDQAKRVRISVDAVLRGLPGNDVSPPLGSINNVTVDELPGEDTKRWLEDEVKRVLKRHES